MKNKTFKIISDYRTFLMGLAIISIIVYHFTEDCFSYKYMFNGWIKTYYKYISAVGVDIFLMLSGLGLFYSMKKNDNTKEFYKKRYIKILIPYLVVAIPSLIQFCIVYNQDIIYFFKELSFINILQEGTRKYWYVFFICICYFIFPVLYKYINKCKETEDVITKVILLTLVVTLFNEMFRVGNPVLYKRISLMIVRFFPFFAGILLGFLSYNKKKITTSNYVSMIICMGLIVLANSGNNALRTYCRFIAVAAFCILFVVLISKIDKYIIISFFKKIVEWFGKYSFEIYLIHVSVRRVFASYKMYPCEIRYFIPYIIISLILVPIVKLLCNLIEKPIKKTLKLS